MKTGTERTTIKNIIDRHGEAFEATFSPENLKLLERISDRIVEVLRRGNKILLCRNGGSAADAQHIAAEFIGRFKRERKSLPAIALTTDSSILTAVANDYSFDVIFERQMEGLATHGDLLIAISTSGNSKNVVLAAKKAKAMNVVVIGLTGKSGAALGDMADLHFAAGSVLTPHIQEMHITALHAVSEAVEDILSSS